MSLLLPEWCDNITDAPANLLYAIQRAGLVLRLMERTDGFKMPPRRLWDSNDERLWAWVRDENNRIEQEHKNGSWDPTNVEGPVRTQSVDDVFSEDAPLPA